MTDIAPIVDDASFAVETGKEGFRRVLLLNPPVYDAQYWARWSQPAGLLRLGTYLRKVGYKVDLIDCMETDAGGHVPKKRLKQIVRDDIVKTIYHFGLSWEATIRRMKDLEETPDEIWIGSIMTYWWESTRDAVTHARAQFPNARIIVGGIYPTLAPEHAASRLGADLIFNGEMKAASHQCTDLSLYKTPPTYAILTTSRGCPWDCNYCAARTLNGGSNKMRERSPEDVLGEIENKMEMGIRHFGFYEDNALAKRGHLKSILELIIERGHKLHLYAPEGFETRLLTEDLLRTMKQAGFRKIHLPFETLKWDTTASWNRRHASTASFDAALEAAISAGFKPRTEEINAFVLFGLPDEKLEDIMDGILYVHHNVGSVIPMLFTPVPGTNMYREQEGYITDYMERQGGDIELLNGKLLPFIEYNRQRYPTLKASDYLEMEAMMSVLNDGKFMSRAVDLCDSSFASEAFRDVVNANRTGAISSPQNQDLPNQAHSLTYKEHVPALQHLHERNPHGTN